MPCGSRRYGVAGIIAMKVESKLMKRLYSYPLLALLLLILFLLIVAAAPVVFQEGTPFQVLAGIIQVELTMSDVVQFSEHKLLQKTGPETPLNMFLAGHGWTFKDRLGAGLFYHRGSEELFVEARMLTRRYIVYEFDRGIGAAEIICP